MRNNNYQDEYIAVLEHDEKIFSYIRKLGNDKMYILMNFSDESTLTDIPGEFGSSSGKLLLSNYNACQEPSKHILLRPYEARIYKLD